LIFQHKIFHPQISQLVENLIPNAQKIILQSDNKFKDVKSVFYFNIEQIVPPLVQEEKEGEVIDKSGDSFHFISYTNITSKY
jgi:hypothetical protein